MAGSGRGDSGQGRGAESGLGRDLGRADARVETRQRVSRTIQADSTM